MCSFSPVFVFVTPSSSDTPEGSKEARREKKRKNGFLLF
jgi:hypothetical protein